MYLSRRLPVLLSVITVHVDKLNDSYIVSDKVQYELCEKQSNIEYGAFAPRWHG